MVRKQENEERIEANIELRVYHDHNFIRSITGTGACTAFGRVYWALWTHNAWSHADGSVNGCAVGAAAADAVRKLPRRSARTG
jgi:hypothetical protein